MVTGAVIGGVVGQHIAGRNGAIVGAMLGTVLGGVVGYEVGRSLEASEKAALQRRMAVALNSGKDNHPYDWTSPKGNAAAKFTADKQRKVDRKTTILRPTNIEHTPALEVIGEPYVVKKDTSLHAGPRSAGTVIGVLKKGQTVVAMGRVKGQPWMAVGSDNRVVGYVPAATVVAAADAASQSFDRVLVAAAPEGNHDNAIKTAAAVGLIADQVETSTACREVNYSVVKDGSEAEKGKVDACKTPDGHWAYQG